MSFVKCAEKWPEREKFQSNYSCLLSGQRSATPCFIHWIVLYCLQHRPLRHCRYGYDGVHTATAACCNGAVEERSCHQTNSSFCCSGRHCEVYQWTRARRLLARRFFESESKSIPRKKFMHCSLKVSHFMYLNRLKYLWGNCLYNANIGSILVSMWFYYVNN